MHPGEGGDGVVETFEGEVGFTEKGVEAGEFGILNAEAVDANAFLGNATKDYAHRICDSGDGGDSGVLVLGLADGGGGGIRIWRV